jgi:sulfonate transport system substrate-binding protein
MAMAREPFAGPLGRNNAVPTTAVTPADVAQISDIADWYVVEKIVPQKPDIAAGVVKLK